MEGDRCSKFKRLRKLGQGTFGVVYQAENLETGQIVAIKRIHLESDQEGVPCTAIREISLLKELDHENIVKLYEIIHDPDKLTLVFEYCDLDLKKYLDQSGGKFSVPKIKLTPQDFLYQLCVGVSFCHKERVLHRDLKPQNLLITRSPEGDVLKLADFGLARGFSVPVRNYSPEVVTLWYRAPEILLGSHNYSKPIDIWSIGCIFVGVPVFKGRNVADEIHCIFSVLGTPNEKEYPAIKDLPQWSTFSGINYAARNFYHVVPELDDDALNLLMQMLCYDPLKRVTAQKALEHPFLTEPRENRLKTKEESKMKDNNDNKSCGL